MDYYQHYICCAANENRIPNANKFDNVFAFTSYALNDVEHNKFSEIKNRISTTTIAKQNDYVMLTRHSHLARIKKMAESGADFNGAILIYSMWTGYTKKDDMKHYLAEMKRLGFTIQELHTSGHANMPDIERLKCHTNAKTVVFVHYEPQSPNVG